jgi:hypothetical protein
MREISMKESFDLTRKWDLPENSQLLVHRLLEMEAGYHDLKNRVAEQEDKLRNLAFTIVDLEKQIKAMESRAVAA